MTDKTRQLSIEKLFGVFHTGLIALVPIFESAELTWKEPDAYDEWDTVAAALYKSIIGSAVEFAQFDSDIVELIPYDRRVNSYSQYSYLAEAKSGSLSAFICFESDKEPFDSCLFATLSQDGEVLGTYIKRITDTHVVLIPRGVNGTTYIETATVVLA